MSDDLRQCWKEHWDFAPPLYMNHGSFGLTPTAIKALKTKFEADLNSDPDFYLRFTGVSLLEEARLAVAKFVNAPPDDLVLVDHVTEAVNTVLKSLSFEAGDEILITSHFYAPYKSLLDDFCCRKGTKLVIAALPFPVSEDDASVITKIIVDKVTERTKLAIIDHITSPTALILPIIEIVRALQDKSVDTYVDGAHGIGQVPLDMQEIGAAYYASNNHKWLSAPLTSGFLYVRPDCQHEIVPAIGSLNADKDHKFVERFQWQGTRNHSGRLCLPETIRYIGALHPEGWEGVMTRNHKLALAGRDILCEKLGLCPSCPDFMVPSMFSLLLGDLSFGSEKDDLQSFERFNLLMRERFGYGLILTTLGTQNILRITAYLYNSLDDYERLADDLARILPEFIKEKDRTYG